MKNNIREFKNEEELMSCLDIVVNSIIKNAKNINVIKNISPSHCKTLCKMIFNKQIEDYYLYCFADKETDEPVGACLLSYGSPWYDPCLLIANEEFIVSFKRGAGVARDLAEFLKGELKKGKVDFIQTGSVNDWCSKMLYNTYTKAGFHLYNNYYMSKEDLIE